MFRSFAEYSAYRNLSQSQERALHFYVSGLIVMIYRFLSGEEEISKRELSLLINENVPSSLKMFLSDDGITGDYILYKVEKNLSVW